MENNISETKMGVPAKTPAGHRALSIILFIASLLSIFICMIVVSEVSFKNHLFTDNMWIFFVFALIPITSVVYGFVIKKKGYKYKKNVIAGIIMAVIMCIYGCFTFIFNGFYTDGLAKVSEVEQTVGIDIPEPNHAVMQDFTGGTQTKQREYLYYTCTAYFEEEQADNIKNQLSESEKWMSKLPNDMFGIMSNMSLYNGSGYVLIYNCNTKQYNTLPDADGKYRFINLIYNAEGNAMQIVEYDVEYIK